MDFSIHLKLSSIVLNTYSKSYMGYKMVTFWLNLKGHMHFIIHLKLPSIEDVAVKSVNIEHL